MKFVALLRSTSERANNIRISIALFICMVACYCNPEKRVLRSPDKTQHVVEAWMKTQNFKADTVFSFLPGDTTTTLLISYDTTTVHDTATHIIEKLITQTRVVTNNIHDTVKVTLKCSGAGDPCTLLKGCQDDLVNNSIVLEEHRIGEERNKLEADKWKFRFYLLVTILGLLAAVVIGIKIFKPKISL
jgi:hypothetical protein